MEPYFTANFGNAGSIHSAGQRARSAVDAARESVAAVWSGSCRMRHRRNM
ncbi:MAG: hypothetical protein ABSF78_13710 [Candidatus Acidiferrales bacterium]